MRNRFIHALLIGLTLLCACTTPPAPEQENPREKCAILLLKGELTPSELLFVTNYVENGVGE